MGVLGSSDARRRCWSDVGSGPATVVVAVVAAVGSMTMAPAGTSNSSAPPSTLARNAAPSVLAATTTTATPAPHLPSTASAVLPGRGGRHAAHAWVSLLSLVVVVAGSIIPAVFKAEQP